MHRRTLLILPAVAVFVAIAAPLQAADWPNRPVTVVVPFAAGDNTDMMARLGAQHLSAKFGQTFVVENRPSAGGALGTGVVAAAAPDGYTLLFAASSMIVLTPQLQKLSFNPEQQLVPITNVGTGTQNISHLAPAWLFARAGVNLVMVPSKGGPQAVSDLMSGQVDLYFGDSSELLPHIDSDRIRLIAVGTAQRLPVAPDIPSVSETLPGFEFSSWNGFLAPTGTPEPIITAIGNEITALAKSPEITERLTKLGIVPGGLTKEQNEAVFRKDRESFAAAIKATGIPAPQ